MGSEIIVAKFGGTSGASRERIKKAREIIHEDPRRRVIVFSAPGKRHPGDRKITDMLEKLDPSKGNYEQLCDAIVGRYLSIYPRMDCNEFRRDLENAVMSGPSNPDARRDRRMIFGERAQAKQFVEQDKERYALVDAMDIFDVSGPYGKGRILPSSGNKIRTVIGKVLDSGKIAIVAGFHGRGSNGDAVALSRGGSDVSGTVAAAELKADKCEIYTDWSVRAADPKHLEGIEPAEIPILTYDEMNAMACKGSQIVHPEAIAPLRALGIPLHVRGTEDFPREGTYVVSERICDPEKPLVGFSYRNGLCSVTMKKDGLDGEERVLARFFGFLQDDMGLDVYIPTGDTDTISVIMEQDQLKEGLKASEVRNGLVGLFGEGTTVDISQDLAAIGAVGKGMKERLGTAAEIYGVFSKARVNIVYNSQNPDEGTVTVGVRDKDGPTAMTALFKAFPYLQAEKKAA